MRTDWNKIADWYGDYLQQAGTYQKEIIFPGVKRLLQPQPDKHYLDIACGEGMLAAFLAEETKANITGIDAAKNLIKQAERWRQRQLRNRLRFLVADAQFFAGRLHEKFDGATCILALQNIEAYDQVLREAAEVLKPKSSFVLVLNHPSFRAPRQSGWGWDDQRKLQYRRVDSYLSDYHVQIDAHPGAERKVHTVSFHRPLQSYVQALAEAGFVITAIEEWASHRASKPGPRGKAENRARQEIPLFMAIKAIYQASQ